MTAQPSWRLLVALYPFGAGAAAVNIFFASLIASWIGWRVLSPYESVAWGLLLGVPATYAFARHIERLKRRAGGG
ncbi:NnrT protein [Leisingera sp. ANG59]|uniref:NnrT protein n=1 Tax=Leisingera sp. ANG59 TaxID=2675221 RepID=UPI001573BF58|nr:NnrT protein [Leisingera sp. ANG59]NSY40602.1 NnrT protein [Leisingera sp. ANG59]